jgi:hypothetical protein
MITDARSDAGYYGISAGKGVGRGSSTRIQIVLRAAADSRRVTKTANHEGVL